MKYLFLFLICFVPLVSIKWSISSRSAAAPSSSSTSSNFAFPFFSKPRERVSTSPPTRPPSSRLTILYRLFQYILRKKPAQLRSRSRPPPPPPAAPLYSSQYNTYFAPPPVVRIPPVAPMYSSPVSKWFPSSSSQSRTRARKTPSRESWFRRRPAPISNSYHAAARNVQDGLITMAAFLGTERSNVDVDLVVLMAHLQAACKQIATVLASPRELQQESSSPYETPPFSPSFGDDPRPMITISNNILQTALRSSGKVAAMSSEADDAPTWFGDDGPYVVVFDPLNGSPEFDHHTTPTSTIFGVYHRILEADHLPLGQKATINVMQRGERLVAAGYALYSSATILCISVGSGLYCFALDTELGEFVLTHPDIRIPERGHIYSVNDGRYFDWPLGLRHYVDSVRQGRGQNRRRYSSCYMASLAADLHRTILYGGIIMNPSSQLQLVHEVNSVSFLVEQGGGRAIDGRRRILEIQPTHLHQRLSLFVGSRGDVSELEAYGDVQQVINIHPDYDDDDDEL
ncbi:unnamed protein product [Sphagnum troendelagicum]|uniref:fructose-bisphosphatase n=1 Tax=Sphagnum troendelagicum TaxID=128251 RepID=A0ABP0UR32_9BRYO